MNQRKYFIIVQVMVGVVLSACGAGKGTAVRSAAPSASLEFEPVKIPSKIVAADRPVWEKTLYLLPLDHPDRRALRDRIAESLVQEFNETPTGKIQQRLRLLEEGLHLHEPVDFSAGMVSEPLVPIAVWAAETFAKRGEESTVLAALKYLNAAKSENAEYQERYAELLEWSQTVRETIVDKIQRTASLIDLFTDMMVLVPDLAVAHKTAGLHLERYKIIQSVFQNGESGYEMSDPRQILIHGRAVQNMPLNIIHIFFLVGDTSLARPYLEGLVADGSLSAGYLEMLDRIFLGEDLADAYFSLAGALVYFDPRAALKAYILGRRAAPQDHRFAMNIGLLFDELACSECAVDFYLETVKLSPSEDVCAKVLALTDKSLERLHYEENASGAKRVIDRAGKLVDSSLAEYPDEDSELRVAAASLLFTMGEVGFDDGRVAEAEAHFARSNEVLPNVPALIKLQEVYYLLNKFEPAMAVTQQALNVDLDGSQGADYLKALILEKQADILLAQGKADDAEALYRQSLALLESGEALMDGSPSAAVQRGFILHQLGDRENSQAAFRLAIRLDPDRAETYGTLISFLVVEGRLNDAVEIYRLAYNQDRIKDMWKIYYSLWVEGLSQRTGKGSVALAKGYLESSSGDSWQDQLAKFFVKKISMDELQKSARNPGQKVETDYYAAISALSEGKREEAKKMLDRVIASDLLGFFEYRMARAILKNEFDD